MKFLPHFRIKFLISGLIENVTLYTQSSTTNNTNTNYATNKHQIYYKFRTLHDMYTPLLELFYNYYNNISTRIESYNYKYNAIYTYKTSNNFKIWIG